MALEYMPNANTNSSIGSANTVLSQYILDSGLLVEDIILRMQGKMKVVYSDGTTELKVIKDAIVYDDIAVLFMQGKLIEILNKNTSLSSYTLQEINNEAREMYFSFCRQIYINKKKFNLTDEMLVDLSSTYLNLIIPMLRHPLGGRISRMLQETTSESTQNVRSQVSEMQEKTNKGGFLGGLFK